MSEFGVESPSRCDESVSQSVADATVRRRRCGTVPDPRCSKNTLNFGPLVSCAVYLSARFLTASQSLGILLWANASAAAVRPAAR